MTRFAFFRGGLVPINQATVSAMTHGLNYWTDCFEGIRAYWSTDHAVIGVRLDDLGSELSMFSAPFGRYLEKKAGGMFA